MRNAGIVLFIIGFIVGFLFWRNSTSAKRNRKKSTERL